MQAGQLGWVRNLHKITWEQNTLRFLLLLHLLATLNTATPQQQGVGVVGTN
jgi:hypothetical protein